MQVEHREFFEQQMRDLLLKEEQQALQLPKIRAKGEAALRRRVEVAHGHSGQCKVIAYFLLGCYNGLRFPFDLTDLRVSVQELRDDCMTVLKMDARPLQEVHCDFPNGGEQFEALADTWRIRDMAQMSADLKRYVEQYGPL